MYKNNGQLATADRLKMVEFPASVNEFNESNSSPSPANYQAPPSSTRNISANSQPSPSAKVTFDGSPHNQTNGPSLNLKPIQSNSVEAITKRTNGHRLVNQNFNHEIVETDIDDSDKNVTINGLSRSDLYGSTADRLCRDREPKFVSQSSICWYVLCVGLSCYILDLILRRLRRSRSPIQLVEARTEGDGNLIELVLSSNHKRFNYWLPGQFVYLNCPRIALYEWHPFTISSMDNEKRQLTLHIKTGGDWTKMLKTELESTSAHYGPSKFAGNTSQNLKSLSHFGQFARGYKFEPSQQQQSDFNRCQLGGLDMDQAHGYVNCARAGKWLVQQVAQANPKGDTLAALHLGGSMTPDMHNKSHLQVASSDCVDHRTGRLRVKCKRIVRVDRDLEHCFQGDAGVHHCSRIGPGNPGPLSHYSCHESKFSSVTRPLELYVDGPFHSPFERLLEQEVSVCVSNGVGWTAFSSVFQRIQSEELNALRKEAHSDDSIWWSDWSNFTSTRQSKQVTPRAPVHGHSNRISVSSNDKSLNRVECGESRAITRTNILHLIVIVTTIEQFKPFYKIASNYFECSQLDTSGGNNHARSQKNLVREVTVFITRCKYKF